MSSILTGVLADKTYIKGSNFTEIEEILGTGRVM
jgi:hypothetical protein